MHNGGGAELSGNRLTLRPIRSANNSKLFTLLRCEDVSGITYADKKYIYI